MVVGRVEVCLMKCEIGGVGVVEWVGVWSVWVRKGMCG